MYSQNRPTLGNTRYMGYKEVKMDLMNTIIELVGIYFTTILRWVFMILALFILVRQIHSLLRARNPSEIWAYLSCPDGSSVPLTHWENLIGRGRGCDVVVNLGSVSRSHATLIRDSAGVWKYNDLESKNGSSINGVPVTEPTEVKGGDIINIGGSDFSLYPVSLQERMENIEKRKKKTHPVSPWPTLVALTIFQLLTIVQFRISLGEEYPFALTAAFMLVCAVMWAYVIIMRIFKRVGFEMEMIAFFLSTLSIAVTATKFPESAFKQAFCVCAGVVLFFGMCWLLRDLNRAKKLVNIFMGAAVLLLLINLVFGQTKNGAANWVSIGGFSVQPSELVKIVFIFVGSATLDELQTRRNLTIFMLFSIFCLGCLAMMGDFGTALIFFATFLIISFLRSGDFSKLVLIIGATGLMGLMIIRFKPHVAARFDTWGHAWDNATEGGFQMVQTMSASASGGFVGLGAGQGHLKWVDAAEADLVFGLLGEEWGLIIAVLAVLCIVTLAVFAVRSIIAGRSTYYSIAACAATSMFIIQTMLNVLGSVDLLPLTGVTFPFVSAGGTSMIATWGLLAYLKAADTRQNASFAIRLDRKKEFDLDEYDDELSGNQYHDPQDFFTHVGEPAANLHTNRSGGLSPDEIEYNRIRQNEKGGTGNSRMDRYDQLSRRAAERSRAGRKPDPDVMRDYTEDSIKDTRTRIGSEPSGRKGPIKYTNVSDDDFFDSFGNEPYREPPRKKPVYNGEGLSKADDEFLTKMMDGPSYDEEDYLSSPQKSGGRSSASRSSEGRRAASAGRSQAGRSPESGRSSAGRSQTVTSSAVGSAEGGRISAARRSQSGASPASGSYESVSTSPARRSQSGKSSTSGYSDGRRAASAGRSQVGRSPESGASDGRRTSSSSMSRGSAIASGNSSSAAPAGRSSSMRSDAASTGRSTSSDRYSDGVGLSVSRGASGWNNDDNSSTRRSTGSRASQRPSGTSSTHSFSERNRTGTLSGRSSGWDDTEKEEPLTLEDLFGGDNK